MTVEEFCLTFLVVGKKKTENILRAKEDENRNTEVRSILQTGNMKLELPMPQNIT